MWCHFCEKKIILPADKGIYNCPNCGYYLIQCGDCQGNCDNCNLFQTLTVLRFPNQKVKTKAQ